MPNTTSQSQLARKAQLNRLARALGAGQPGASILAFRQRPAAPAPRRRPRSASSTAPTAPTAA